MFSLLAAEENFDDWKNIPNYNYDPMGFAKWVLLHQLKYFFILLFLIVEIQGK